MTATTTLPATNHPPLPEPKSSTTIVLSAIVAALLILLILLWIHRTILKPLRTLARQMSRLPGLPTPTTQPTPSSETPPGHTPTQELKNSRTQELTSPGADIATPEELTYLQWTKPNEFGVIAQAANRLINTILHKTEQIKHLDSRQQALIAGLPDAICVFSSKGDLSSIYKQPDYTSPIPGLIVGSPLSPPIFAESDCQTFRSLLTRAFKSNTVQLLMIACRTQDNTYRHLETRITRIEPIYALVVFRDVTKEWRERESRQLMEGRLEQIARIESMGHLAANIAHDFNNILAIIQNTLDACWGTHVDAGHREAISTLRDATNRGANLTRELMTYAGHTQFALQQIPLNRLINDTEKLLTGLLADHISLDLRLTSTPLIVDADPLQFWKVIINILKNAVEAIGDNRGHISIRTYPFTMTESARREFFSTNELALLPGAIIQIDDTGRGIPPDILPRLFEPFYSTKSVRRGLGLSTVFGIVDAHSGAISIASTPSVGSTFRIWLPLSTQTTASPLETPSSNSDPDTHEVGRTVPRCVHASGEPQLNATEHSQNSKTQEPKNSKTPNASTAPAPEHSQNSRTQELKNSRTPNASTQHSAPSTHNSATTAPALPAVLSIEDDPAILKTNGLLLKMLGVQPLLASTRHEAQALFRRHAPQIALILIDAQSGRLDNVRLLNVLRARHPNIPTIVTSGLSASHIAELFASTPYNGYLAKPYTFNDLKQVIQQYIPTRE